MAQKFVIKFSAVAEFFKDNSRQLVRGENAVASGHVQKVIFNPEVQPALLKGEVHASMRNKVYTIEVSISNDGAIINAVCTCPRGEVVCHHIAALCIYAHHNVSVTDTLCSWNAPKANVEEILTIEAMYPKKEPGYSAISKPNTDEEITEFKSALAGLHVPVGFTWLLSEDKGSTISDLIVQIEIILFCEDYLKAPNKSQYFIEQSEINTEKVMEVVERTIGQAVNENWQLCRKHRLTASKFGLVLSACARNKIPPSLFVNLTESYDLGRVKAIQWGREYEKTGVEYFKKQTGWDVTPTGLWLHTCGFLGASPDGLVHEDALIEVKCPYKYRNSSLEVVLNNDKSYIVYFENGELIVNVDHIYYHQIQGQLYMTGREKCYLIIWTPAEAIIAEVAKNLTWEANLTILQNFYITKYVPYLCGKNFNYYLLE